jgi:hypothetical protein
MLATRTIGTTRPIVAIATEFTLGFIIVVFVPPCGTVGTTRPIITIATVSTLAHIAPVGRRLNAATCRLLRLAGINRVFTVE